MKFAHLQPNKKIGEFAWNHQALLGSGAFGKVYLGKNTKTGDICAIKEQSSDLLKDSYMKEALKNEINIMKTVKSPYIVNLLEVYQTSNHIYIILEFCDGGDVRSLLTKKGKLTEKEALQIFHDILMGFEALVKNSVIHRDLKPENVLIHKDARKLADFGLSRVVNDFNNKMLQTGCGTPLYMAPQILMNEQYTTKCDIWSLGLLLYEFLFANTPWPCKSQYELLQNIQKKPVQFPNHSEISNDTRDFLKRSLQFKEVQRMNWKDVFSHPIFVSDISPQKKPRLQKQFSLDIVSKQIITKIQKLFQEQNLMVEDIFDEFDKDELNMKDFVELILDIDKSLAKTDIEKIFQQIDVNLDQSLSIQELKQYIFETNYEFKEGNEMLEIQRGNKLVKKLKDLVEINNLDLKRIFRNFDKSMNNSLDQKEFYQILKAIDPDISEKEGQYIFKKFDKNGDGDVSLKEFEESVFTYNDQDQGNALSKNFGEHVQNCINDLRRIIKRNNLDTQVIFSSFDKSKDGELQYDEFRSLIMIINSKLNDKEIKEIFQTFDKNHDNGVSYSEFMSYLH